MSCHLLAELRGLLLRRLQAELALDAHLHQALRDDDQAYFQALQPRAARVGPEAFCAFVRRAAPEIQPEAADVLFRHCDADADGAVSRKELAQALRLSADFSFTEDAHPKEPHLPGRRSGPAEAAEQLGLAFLALLAHLARLEADRARFYNLPGFCLPRLFSELAAGKSAIEPEDLRRFLGAEQPALGGETDAALRLYEILRAGGGQAGLRAFRRQVTPQYLGCEALLAGLAPDPRFETPQIPRPAPADFEDRKHASLQLFDSYRPPEASAGEEDYRLVESLRGGPGLAESRADSASPFVNLQAQFLLSQTEQFRSPPREQPQPADEPPRLRKRKQPADSLGSEAEADASLQESFTLLGPESCPARAQEFADYPHAPALELRTPQPKAPALGYSFFDAPLKDPLGREASKPSEQSAKAVTKRLAFGSHTRASLPEQRLPPADRLPMAASPDSRGFRLQPVRTAAGSVSRPFEASGRVHVRFAADTPGAGTFEKRSLLKRGQRGTGKHEHTHSTGLKDSDWESAGRREKSGGRAGAGQRAARTSATFRAVERQIRFEELF